MTFLGAAASRAGRSNNFNLIRFVAAFCVLLSHSVALSTGDPSLEPLRATLGMSLGSLAVVVFFFTSGYLVGGSLVSRGDALHFVVSRTLRIFPALLAAVALTVLVAGPWVTTMPLASYWRVGQTWRYWFYNSIVFAGNQNLLPGVFQGNAYPGTVNGSLWSVSYELWMYVILFVLWLLARGRRPETTPNRLSPCVFALIAAADVLYFLHGAQEPAGGDIAGKASWLIPAFFIGTACHLHRDRIELRWPWALLAAAGLIASALAGPGVFMMTNIFCIGYLVVYVAYAIPVVPFTLRADYSYGMYLYAFPVQQLCVHLLPGIGVGALTACATAVTLALAVASWHLIERRALGRVEPMVFWLGNLRRRRQSA